MPPTTSPDVNKEAASQQSTTRTESSLITALRGIVTEAVIEAPRAPKGCGEGPCLCVQDIGRVEIVRVRGSAVRVQADADPRDSRLVAVILSSGRGAVRQGGQTTELGAGDLCFIRSGREATLTFEGAFEIILVMVPEQVFAEQSPLWRAALSKRIPATVGAPAVFLDAIQSLQRWRDTLGHASADGIGNALVDLMGAVVCFGVPADSGCVMRSLYHRERVKQFAQENLRNPELNVERIAEAVKLSPRQIHRLFANEAMSLMRWVWVRRLENCHRELREPASAKRTISDIAYAWGFNDQAHFSRAFRKHFGVSPRDVRRQLVHGAGAETQPV